ncbi:MAG: hypothetical protein Q9218_002148 [Villophora microphyllina]
MSTSALYQYKPLNFENSLRLLKLAPATSWKADIHCVLIDITLSTATEYEALSYVWGKDEYPNTLHLPNGYLKITDSLASALKRLRSADSSRTLWVDAVCIDQTNPMEKAQQVAQMAEIYRNAMKVVAWLGEEPQLALDMPAIHALSRKAQEIGLRSPSDNDRDIVRAYVYGNSDRVQWVLGFMSAVENSGFPAVYQSAWFTRMWIVQEALLAKHLKLCCGAESLDWDDFERVMMLIHAVNGAIRLPMSHRDAFVKYAWNLVQVRDTWCHRHRESRGNQSDEAPEVMFYMHQLRRRKCKDDRDRVFALQGLLSEKSQLIIQPDYSKTVVQIYVELARNLLRCGIIGVLYDAGLWKRRFFQLPDLSTEHSDHGSWADYLPTWVPDFRKDTAFVELAETQFGGFFGADPRVPQSLDFPKEPYRLTTQATLVDIITSVPPALFIHREALRTNDVNMFFAVRRFCKDLLRAFDARLTTGRYPNGEDSATAFAHAIVGGYNSDNDEVDRHPLDLWKLYERYCMAEDGEVYLGMLTESNSTMSDRKTVKGVRQDFYSNVSAEGGTAWGYHHRLVSIFRRHWFFMSDGGYAGLAPMNTQPETDVLAFINGANVPFVVRDLGEDSSDYLLIGPCYIHGLMDGHAVKKNKAFASGVGTIQII